MDTYKRRSAQLAATLAIGLSGCAHDNRIGTVYDPAEGLNRKVFAVNQQVDRHVLRPVARTYLHVPAPARRVVDNFLVNLNEPLVLVNDVLQLNLSRAEVTLGRFTINTTVGLGGALDVAHHVGLQHHEGDFGQTLGRWGVPPGAQIQLPLFGPSDLRDTTGRVVDAFINPFSFASGGAVSAIKTSKTVGGIIEGRAELLPRTDKISATSPDYYIALRDMSAAHRAALVHEARTGVRVTPADDQPPAAVPDLAAQGGHP